MIFKARFCMSRGLFLDVFFLQSVVRRCSEISSLCNWRKNGTQANSSNKTTFFMICQCSHTRRGRRENGTRGSKREPKQHTTTQVKPSKNVILKGPGPSIKKTTSKPRKSDPREAKMTPRSGPGGPGSGTLRRPKSRPEAVSERPWWPPGAHLAPKRPPGGFREAF